MKRNKKILLILLGVLVLAGVIGAVWVGTGLAPAVRHGLRISELLQPVINAENQTMHIAVSAAVGDEPIRLESDVYMLTEENVRYLVLEQNEAAVYVTDNILLLENGKAFRFGEKLQEQTVSYEDLLPRIGTLYDALKVTAEESDGETVYSVTVTGEQVNTLLVAASLGEALPVEGIEKLEIQLTEKDGKLGRICFAGSGEGDGTPVELEVTVSGFRILASGDYPIPDAVRAAAETVDPDELFSLSEDLYRLIRALTPFADMESVDGRVLLAVDCGLIQLDTEMKLSELAASEPGRIDSEQLKALPEMIGLLCMEGDIRCTGEGDAYVYTLELDREAMQQLARMILGELEQYGGSLTEGTVTILLEEGTITCVDISIEGTVSALLVQIPITVGAIFLFD